MTGSTSRSSSCRGQTEPVAALVAVAVFATALGIFGVLMTDVSFQEDRKLAEPTNDRVWEAVSDSDTYSPDATDIPYAVNASDVPDGHYTYVVVITYGEGGKTVQNQSLLGPGGTAVGPKAPSDEQLFDEYHYNEDGTVNEDAEVPPNDADVSEETIEVSVQQGLVRGGLLRVEVW